MCRRERQTIPRLRSTCIGMESYTGPVSYTHLSQLDAGTSDNKVTSFKVMRGTVNVTKNYNIGTEDGDLTVTARDVKLTSGSGSKVYDGTPLTNSNVEVSGDGFVDGEGAVYTVTGSQLAAGSSRNEFGYTCLLYTSRSTEKSFYVLFQKTFMKSDGSGFVKKEYYFYHGAFR